MLRKKVRPDPRQIYPILADLMGNNGYYFYQDWRAEFDSAEDIIQTFCVDRSAAEKRQAVKEITLFLKDYAEEAPRTRDKVLYLMGNAYDYARARYTAVSWLRHLQAEIQKSLE